jgi:hypothetical protein
VKIASTIVNREDVILLVPEMLSGEAVGAPGVVTGGASGVADGVPGVTVGAAGEKVEASGVAVGDPGIDEGPGLAADVGE